MQPLMLPISQLHSIFSNAHMASKVEDFCQLLGCVNIIQKERKTIWEYVNCSTYVSPSRMRNSGTFTENWYASQIERQL